MTNRGLGTPDVVDVVLWEFAVVVREELVPKRESMTATCGGIGSETENLASESPQLRPLARRTRVGIGLLRSCTWSITMSLPAVIDTFAAECSLELFHVGRASLCDPI